MITQIGSVAILVNDARRSAEWYRDKLGFEIVGMEGHAVFVKPKGSPSLIHLCERCGIGGRAVQEVEREFGFNPERSSCAGIKQDM